jgi:hypothetical protein
MGLEDFLPHRRAALLWRYAPELDYDGVDDLVRRRAGGTCERRWPAPIKAGQQAAVLGDDSRYHLLVNGFPACGGKPRAEDPVDVVRHKQWCYWWTDGVRYRIRAPSDALSERERDLIRGQTGERVASWLVRLTDVVEIPGLVPARSRCLDDLTWRSPWPGYQGGDNALGRLRARLVRRFGPLCCTCGEQWGTHVDHDHFTGRVRGLLCGGCNSHVDGCPHASGCVFGDYLNDPPAARLDLRYPRSPRAERDPDGRVAQKIAALGFDPLYRGVKDEQRRAPHLPAPPHSGGDLSVWVDVSLFENTSDSVNLEVQPQKGAPE